MLALGLIGVSLKEELNIGYVPHLLMVLKEIVLVDEELTEHHRKPVESGITSTCTRRLLLSPRPRVLLLAIILLECPAEPSVCRSFLLRLQRVLLSRIGGIVVETFIITLVVVVLLLRIL